MRTLPPLLPTRFWATADLFRADERPGKINLGIGVYKDETGKTPVLTSVKKAEQYLLENETTKNYLGIDGIPEFGRCTQELLFGKGSALINDKRARTAQTPGGTGTTRGCRFRQKYQR